MNVSIIGTIRSCYGEKFGVPRQPGLVKEAWGELVLEPEFRNKAIVRGLEDFSHVWIVFLFHQVPEGQWKPTVRPPRLGGNERVGTFASRSPFRPNPIGLSSVKLESIDFKHSDAPVLHLSGVDLVDGTPVLDIKPYVPYSDSIPDAYGAYANEVPTALDVRWDESIDQTIFPTALIEATLSADPRPAYQQQESEREYGCLIDGYNVIWVVVDNCVIIRSCVKSQRANNK